MKAKALVLLIHVLFFSGLHCLVEENAMSANIAQSEIYSAIEYKAKECKGQPSYPLLILHHPTEYSVRLCSLTIIRSKCPFTDYPVFCLEMYGADIPAVGEKR